MPDACWPTARPIALTTVQTLGGPSRDPQQVHPVRQNAEWRKQAARLRAMPDANNGQVAGTCSRMAVCNGAEEMSSPRVSTRMNHSPPPQIVVLARPSRGEQDHLRHGEWFMLRLGEDRCRLTLSLYQRHCPCSCRAGGWWWSARAAQWDSKRHSCIRSRRRAMPFRISCRIRKSVGEPNRLRHRLTLQSEVRGYYGRRQFVPIQLDQPQ